jgi:hypothetical protein
MNVQRVREERDARMNEADIHRVHRASFDASRFLYEVTARRM